MASKSEEIQPRKRGGRPATGRGTPVQVRFSSPALARLDAWIERQPEPRLSRPEAVRRILAEALAKPAGARLNASDDAQ